MAFGAAASIAQRVTFPSVDFTSIWIQACGLINSNFATVPRILTGLVASNSAANAWCAHRETGTRSNVATAAKRILLRMGFLLLFLRGFRGSLLFRAGCAQLVHHSVVTFMTRVFKILVSRFLTNREGDREGRC